jgi:hypothetical protein
MQGFRISLGSPPPADVEGRRKRQAGSTDECHERRPSRMPRSTRRLLASGRTPSAVIDLEAGTGKLTLGSFTATSSIAASSV